MSNPLNFFKYWKKKGFKKAVKQWKYNFVMLETPEWSLKKEIIGYSGAIGGLILAIVFLSIRKNWLFIPFLIFLCFLQYTQLKMRLKQYTQLRMIKNPDLFVEYKEVKK